MAEDQNRPCFLQAVIQRIIFGSVYIKMPYAKLRLFQNQYEYFIRVVVDSLTLHHWYRENKIELAIFIRLLYWKLEKPKLTLMQSLREYPGIIKELNDCAIRMDRPFDNNFSSQCEMIYNGGIESLIDFWKEERVLEIPSIRNLKNKKREVSYKVIFAEWCQYNKKYIGSTYYQLYPDSGLFSHKISGVSTGILDGFKFYPGIIRNM